jgi:hypothetical protein
MIRSIAIVLFALLTSISSASDVPHVESGMSADSVLAIPHAKHSPGILNFTSARAAPAMDKPCYG